MSRKRLWSLTALACALLVVPSVPRADLHLPALASVTMPPALLLAATACLVLLVTLVVVRRRRTPSDLAVALARRGRPVAAIARQTRLSQDAVRDLLGGDPVAVSTAGWGRFFRRRSGAPSKGTASFADELNEKSFDAKA